MLADEVEARGGAAAAEAAEAAAAAAAARRWPKSSRRAERWRGRRAAPTIFAGVRERGANGAGGRVEVDERVPVAAEVIKISRSNRDRSSGSAVQTLRCKKLRL